MTCFHKTLLALAVTGCCQFDAAAFTFGNDAVSGNFDSTLSLGLGRRTENQDVRLINQGNQGGPAGQLDPLAGLGDQGTLNYNKGDYFTQYVKGSHELLLKLPSDVKFMARANWLRDYASTRTTGYLSSSATTAALQDGFAEDARRDAKFKGRVLDLWVSKSFEVADQQVRVRLGNQVISWGESLFLPGGINASNALDIQRLSQPGTQLKEVYLPAPMLSVASGLGNGLNFEAYVQSRWNASYFPPTGTYWSVVNGLGKGASSYGLASVNARDGGQWGAALRWQPKGTQVNLGLYAVNYHDKTPNFSFDIKGTGQAGWTYAEDRKLYGISANAALGDWALGTELSYRPKDAVALNPTTVLTGGTGCNNVGNCWVDEKRYQWHGTALYSMTPDNAESVLNLLGAQTATFMFEAVVISYPKMRQTYNNGADYVAAGVWGWGWGFEPGAAGTPAARGSKTSGGYNFDFSWVYDGTLLPGWQVIPEVYFFHAVKGRTPNAVGLFMQGAKSANLIVSFVQNPATWQFGVNFAKFWGGSTVFDQPLRDRDFVGAYLSRNF